MIIDKLKGKRVLTVIIIIVAVFFIFKGFGKKVQYETMPVEKRTITQVVEASGTINPINKFSVNSTVSGLVNAVYADYNSVVKK